MSVVLLFPKFTVSVFQNRCSRIFLNIICKYIDAGYLSPTHFFNHTTFNSKHGDAEYSYDVL
jgi:hypothetical protein